MSIEDNIQQKGFKNEFQKLAINILYTGSWLYNMNAARLKEYKLTPEQYNVLRILRGAYPNKIMLQRITSRMIDKSSNATRLVEKLRLKLLVKRELCQENRRQVDIQITPKGLSLLSTIEKEEEKWLGTLKSLKLSEAKELNYLLEKLRGE